MAEVVIRAAEPEDVDELVRLGELMYVAMGVLDGDTDSSADWVDRRREVLAEMLVDDRACAFVADVGGPRLVGSGIGLLQPGLPAPHNPSGLTGYLLSMMTEPEWRGQGVATGIVQQILDWFQAREVVRVSLHASAAGEPIYRSLGFTDPAFPELRWKPA
jgi:GNAT superfamily N-acetyltransferase